MWIFPLKAEINMEQKKTMKYRKYKAAFFALALALGMGGCCWIKGEASDREVSLLTYNIQVGKSIQRKESNVENAAALIRSIGAETVVLNEVDFYTERTGKIDQPKIIAEAGNYHYCFGVAFLFSNGEYGNVVMSKYPLERVALLRMGDDGNESRSATLVKVLAPEPYYVLGTHFLATDGEESEAIRMASIDRIVEYIEKHNLSPVVLMGDLNTPPDSPSINYLREKGFFVTNDLVPGEVSFPADDPNILLDYIAIYPANAAECLDHYVVEDDHTSDHRPVYSRVRFR